MENSRNLVLDLHGRRLDDAIREVTLFLERIRREHATVRATSGASNAAASASAVGSAVVENPLYATIITGSGSVGFNSSCQ